MVKKFSEILNDIKESESYKEFIKNNEDYYLAHGFIQLDKDFKVSKDWQLGFYSLEKDNLALFHTKPIKFVGFEDAFKKEGTIDELKFDENFIDIDKVETIVSELMAKEYSEETSTSYICIIQNLNGKELFNITSITASLSMITMRIDAKSGEIIDYKKSSILDLKKDDNEKLSDKKEGEE